jgi:hypothetical protein
MNNLQVDVNNFLNSDKFNGQLLIAIAEKWADVKGGWSGECSITRVRRCANIRKELIGNSKSPFVQILTDFLDSGLSTQG